MKKLNKVFNKASGPEYTVSIDQTAGPAKQVPTQDDARFTMPLRLLTDESVVVSAIGIYVCDGQSSRFLFDD